MPHPSAQPQTLPMITLGMCRICEAGPLGLRKCGVCRRVVVLCDECDAAWLGGDTSGPPTYATEDDMPCPGCRGSLLHDGSRWATTEEASAAGWDGDRVASVAAGEPTAGRE